MPKNCHIVFLTRFCNRSFQYVRTQYADATEDPHSEFNLEFRLRLLELFCFSSVVGQRRQDFDWVLFVDPDLPKFYRDRISRLADMRDRTFVKIFPRDEQTYQIDWLKGIVPEGTDWLVTINHDDDDLLPPDYTERLAECLQRHVTLREPPVFRAFGLPRTVLWDLHFSTIAPWGFLAPYHRRSKVSSCGFGLLTKFPEMNYNVLGLTHSDPLWLGTNEPKPLYKFRPYWEEIERLDQLGLVSKDDLRRGDRYFEPIYTERPVIMTNHTRNVQWCRVLEYKPGKWLAGSSDLEPYGLNLKLLQEHAEYFKLPLERVSRFYRWKPYQLIANIFTFPLVLLRTLLHPSAPE